MRAIMQKAVEELLLYSVIFEHKPDKSEGRSHAKNQEKISRAAKGYVSVKASLKTYSPFPAPSLSRPWQKSSKYWMNYC